MVNIPYMFLIMTVFVIGLIVGILLVVSILTKNNYERRVRDVDSPTLVPEEINDEESYSEDIKPEEEMVSDTKTKKPKKSKAEKEESLLDKRIVKGESLVDLECRADHKDLSERLNSELSSVDRDFEFLNEMPKIGEEYEAKEEESE